MKSIYVFDDDATRQRTMNQHFTMMGFRVRSFSSIVEFEKADDTPLVIVLDNGLSKYESKKYAHLKKVRRMLPFVPVIYMTNDSEKSALQEAKKKGAYTAITKDSAAYVKIRTALDEVMSKPSKAEWLKKVFEWISGKKTAINTKQIISV